MTVKEALEKAKKLLIIAGIEAPVAEAGVMLCHTLGCGRVYIYSHNDMVLSESIEKRYFELIAERCSKKPLQYITGFVEFMSLSFEVDENVLIPRQDTEVLVETVMDFCGRYNDNNPDALNILDIGTGSGCIAVSLAYYLKNCKITAVDISAKALAIAAKNAARHNVDDRVRFIQSDLFDKIDFVSGDSTYNVIVSNPPYISEAEFETLQPEVRLFEPRSALVGGYDGLDFYRSIINEAPRYLKTGGMLAFETGYLQAGLVSAMFEHDFMEISIIKDLSGKERVVAGILTEKTEV